MIFFACHCRSGTPLGKSKYTRRMRYIYQMYKMYKIYEEYKVESIWGSMFFAKELEAGHFPAKDLPPKYDSRSTWEFTLAI